VTHTVTLIPGDGIGAEITAQTVKVLEATGIAFAWDEQIAGVAALEAIGTPIPDAMLESIHRHRVALKGPPVAGTTTSTWCSFGRISRGSTWGSSISCRWATIHVRWPSR
jgi:isocitrate/isopropylmalate dehydrogenase